LGPEEAADATQETYLIAAGRLDDISPDSERAFLIGTARRVAHTLGRKTLRWQLDEDMDQRISSARDASDEHADLQLFDIALSKMNPELAEAFVLYEIEGLSSPEIAALLEIPLGKAPATTAATTAPETQGRSELPTLAALGAATAALEAAPTAAPLPTTGKAIRGRGQAKRRLEALRQSADGDLSWALTSVAAEFRSPALFSAARWSDCCL
jgi:RNA polymerase sigma factor (sigma-70 family)